MLSDEKFYDRAQKFTLLKNTESKYFSFDEYKTLIESNQKDKNNKIVYLYATDKEEQYSYIESAKNRGYDVLLLDNQLDSHFVNLLESKFTDSTFARVDAGHIDSLISKEEISKPDLSESEISDISTAFESILPAGPHYSVTVENLGEQESAVLITQSEFMRSYREMSAMGGGMNFYGSMPESYNLIVNNNHPVIKKILNEKEEKLSSQIEKLSTKLSEPQAKLKELEEKIKDKKEEEIETTIKDEKETLEKEINSLNEQRRDKVKEFASKSDLLKQVCDLALLSNGMLKGEELNKFVKRSLSLIK